MSGCPFKCPTVAPLLLLLPHLWIIPVPWDSLRSSFSFGRWVMWGGLFGIGGPEGWCDCHNALPPEEEEEEASEDAEAAPPMPGPMPGKFSIFSPKIPYLVSEGGPSELWWMWWLIFGCWWSLPWMCPWLDGGGGDPTVADMVEKETFNATLLEFSRGDDEVPVEFVPPSEGTIKCSCIIILKFTLFHICNL